MPFTITLFYAALLAVILILLSLRVVLLRRRLQVGIGTGQNQELSLAVRAHGNFCEYVPLALLLLLMIESSAALPTVMLHLLGAMLLAGRLLHGFFGLNRSPGISAGRFLGTSLTWLTILAAALCGLWIVIGRWLVAA